VVAGLGLLVVGLIGCWLVGTHLMEPANHPVGPAPADLGVREVEIASGSGASLAGWWMPLESGRATVILLHPLHGDRRAMLGRARLLRAAGYELLLVDLQAHGESMGAHTTAGWLERLDARAAVDFVRRERPKSRIGVIGWSLGGAATLLASPLGIDAAVLESVYPTIGEAIHNRIAIRLGPLAGMLTPLLTIQLPLRLGIDLDDLAPIDHIASLACPVLILGGALDEHTPADETRRLFDRAAEPKRLMLVPGAAHTDLQAADPDLYEREVLAFFALYL